MTASRRIFLPVLLSVAIAFGGCSTVRYLETKPPTPKQATGLPEALSYLDSARLEYQGRVETQMKTENILANSLVGAGALVMALAVGGANSNVVAGTALAAGTAYGLGNFNLPRQRVLIYMAGVEALSCAQKAVGPIFVTEAELKALQTALEALRASLPALQAALFQGKAELPNAAAGATEGPQLAEALALGEQVLNSATATLNTGRTLLQTTERAARDLVAAVNGIDEAVVRSLVLATPELSAVPGLVSGLAGLSAAFAPGAGVDTLIAGKLEAASNRVVDTVKSGIQKKSTLLIATERIVAAATDTTRLDAEVQSRLPRLAVPWAEDAFKNCGIAQVVQALSVPESPLKFVAGVNDRRTFVILGGVKPYFVRLEGVDGLSAKSPIRFDNQAEVALDASKLSADSVKSELRANVRVIDSSPTARSLDVPVIVAPATPASAASASAPKTTSPITPSVAPATGDSSPLGADLQRLQQVSQFKFANKTFTLKKKPVLNGDTIEATVNCPAGNAEVHPRADLERALLDKAGLAASPQRKLRLTTVPANCAT